MFGSGAPLPLSPVLIDSYERLVQVSCCVPGDLVAG
jgi:hypothetical protein